MQALNLSESVSKVVHFLQQNAVECDFRTLGESTRTAQMAADVLACSAAEIATSLIFQDANSQELVLIISSGGHRVDLNKVQQQTGRKLIKASGKMVKTQLDYAIGGIPPVAHSVDLPTYFDRTLLNFDTVWAAAGSPFAVFGIAPNQLCALSGASILDIAEEA